MTLWQVCHQSGRVLFTTDNEVTARNREQFGWKVIKVDKSREQFEAYYAEYFGQSLQWVIDRRCENKDFSGYQMGTGLQSAWKMWQASRAAIEIELPRRKAAYASGYGDGYLVDSLMGDALEYEETVDAIRAAGIKVKE